MPPDLVTNASDSVNFSTLWNSCAAQPQSVCRILANAVPSALGRVHQARDGWPRPGSPLSGPVHASCRHQQSPPACFRRRTDHLSLERLCAWQPAAPDDLIGIRVLTALCATCSAARFRSHPPVRIPCKPISCCSTHMHPPVASARRKTNYENREHTCRCDVELPPLRRLHADRLQTHGPGTIFPMHGFRHVLARARSEDRPTRLIARPQSCVSSPQFDCSGSFFRSHRPGSTAVCLFPRPIQAAFRRAQWPFRNSATVPKHV
jgi:hypothetical protein